MNKQELLQFIEYIEYAAKQKMTSLDLSTNQLSELPPEIGQLTHLTSLTLRNNQLSELPPEISQLTNLTSLDLGENQLSELPPEIGQLTHLTTLNLYRNELGELPSEIGQLTNLTLLYLDNNQLSELPPEIGQLTNLTSLTLRNNKLSELPPEIFQLINLTSLNLSANKLSELPPEIVQLTNLTSLNLSNNPLSELPPEIVQLTNLTSLTLSNNPLSALPPEIVQLTNLTSLTLSNNKLSELPPEIGQLTNLTSLTLSNNKLSGLPPEIGQLTNLTSLTLSANKLSALPPEIGQLTNLTLLTLSANKLSALPPEIGQLTNLTSLNLSHNQLSELPPETGQLTNLTSLTSLTLTNNPLATPPLEIARQGIEAIALYFEQLAREGATYLFEAKLLIVGEGEAGKTTLARKIKDQSYQLQPAEARTEGIDIIQWHFPHNQDQDFQVNIWDFGGQEVYHATHQFFLTKRSLYVLVVANRKGHTDLHYWLNVVELLSDNSPLLLIQNEKDDYTVEINISELRGRFANLKETLPTNLKTNRGLDDILNHLKHYLTNLPHIKDKIPKTWLKVREVLAAHKHDYISLTEYLTICSDNGLDGSQEQLQLSRYLHDLGVCLHFQDDFILKQTVILKPTWGTDAVYRVLDNEQVKKKQGRFSQDDLARIWAEDRYAAKQHALLRLMVKFKLCYPLPEQDGWYIAPHLLTKNKPDYPWNDAENLIVRYTYEFMPKGIISLFIVVMHRYIEQQSTVWHSGIILNKDETRAEVIEKYETREISVRVRGRYKRDLMTIISNRLDEIHQSYPRLKHSQLVPCNCSMCKNSQTPHFYIFENLRKRIANQVYEVQCEESYEMVNVLQLIDDSGLKEQATSNQEENINIVKFKDLLSDKFSTEELEELCFRLHVDHDVFGTKSKTSLARKMVQHFQKRGELDRLYKQALAMRPNSKDEFLACLK